MTDREHGAAETRRLLEAVEAVLRQYVILNPHQYAAVAAWVMHTYCWQLSDCTPYLIVTSAEKRSGKTRLIEILCELVHHPYLLQSPTEAVLFRVIDQRKPTLFIDETDAIFRDTNGGPSERQEALRGVINGGFRSSGHVSRLSPSLEIMDFSTFCPKVLAGIGHLPDTIEDRGLPVRLVRKDVGDTVLRFRERIVKTALAPLRNHLDGWGAYALIHLDGEYPDMPEGLDDRAQDMYELLVAIGDLAGGEWSERIRTSLVTLRTGQAGADKSPGVRLLEDLSLIDLSGRDMIPTPELLQLLYQEGEQPYEDWWGEASGKKAAMRLAKLLGEYGVKPHQYREGTYKRRGYVVREITSEVARYAYQVGTNGTSLQMGTFQVGTNVEAVPTSKPAICRDVPTVPTSPAEMTLEGFPVGSPEWLATAPMDEIRELFDPIENPEDSP